MKNVLFILVPSPSHYYPTFGLAHLLEEQGYCVSYTGSEECRFLVESEKFTFCSIEYLDEMLTGNAKVIFCLWIKTLLDPLFTKNRYKRFIRQMQSVEQVVVKAQPDIVFLDDTLTHYYSCLKKVKIIQISTKLSPQKKDGIPPLDSFYIPRVNVYNAFVTNSQWHWHVFKRKFTQRLNQVVFIGFSGIDFLRKYEKKKGIDYRKVYQINVCFSDILQDTTSIVLAPKLLDFNSTESAKNEYHIYIPYNYLNKKCYTDKYNEYIEKIKDEKKHFNTRLVYVSLGTLSSLHYSKAYGLLKSIIEALGGIDNINVLIATGNVDLSDVKMCSNIFCLNEVPQVDVLRYSDIMITHGGLGSIKECVLLGVPMLVLPLNVQVDQPSNSARVVNLGIGLRGKRDEKAVAIRKKVTLLLNTNKFKYACNNLSNEVTKEVLNSMALVKETQFIE